MNKELINNFCGHLSTITRHRHMVMKHCIMAGIPIQGLLHDLSKYTPEEFIPGVLNYQGTRSPNEGEREKKGYSSAWLHHKGRNKHHFEYWTDYNINTKKVGPVPMPRKYIVEMFCDRVAASKIYNGDKYTDGDSLAYYQRAKAKREIDHKTGREIEKLLKMLAEKGEMKTFSYIKRVYLPSTDKRAGE